jgi:hypothetical protein
LLALFVVLAERLGLEAILGAFLAGAILKLVDRDQMMTHPQFRQKLEAVGYGVFIPVFFVATGVRFDLNALFASATNLARVPISSPPCSSPAACRRLSTDRCRVAGRHSRPRCYRQQPRSASWSSRAKSV